DIVFFVRYFKSASEIDKVEFFKVFSRIKQNLSSIEKHFDIQNIRTRMHVDSVNMHFGVFHDSQNMRKLMNRNSELAVDMTYRDIGISSCHYVRIDTDTYRSFRIFRSELL